MRQIGRRRLLHFFHFKTMDRRPKPGTERCLNLLLRPGTIQRLESLSAQRQRDMSAWNLFFARGFWDKQPGIQSHLRDDGFQSPENMTITSTCDRGHGTSPSKPSILQMYSRFDVWPTKTQMELEDAENRYPSVCRRSISYFSHPSLIGACAKRIRDALQIKMCSLPWR